LTSLVAVLLMVAAAQAADPVGIIVQFNGKKVGDATADTKDKAFKPIFEKDLADIATKLPGKPTLVLKDWYTIINGGSIKWDKAEKETPKKLKEALEKLPYVKVVEFDTPVPPPGR
jgi:hypothetical protein